MSKNRPPPLISRLGDADNACILGFLFCVFLALAVAGGMLCYFGFFSDVAVTSSAPHHLSAAMAALGPLLLLLALLTLGLGARLFREGGCWGRPSWLQRQRPYTTMEEETRAASDNAGYQPESAPHEQQS